MAGQLRASVRGLQTLSGGTRTSVKIDRPWQPKLKFPETSAQCPFCSRSQTDEFTPEVGWKTFQNSNTPFPYHRLLVPTSCWDEATLRSLGNAAVLERCWRIALAEIQRTRSSLFPIWIYAHIGYGAGQNLTHLHFHLCEAPTTPKPVVDDEFGVLPGGVPLRESERMETYLAGVRAGHAFVVLRLKTYSRTWHG